MSLIPLHIYHVHASDDQVGESLLREYESEVRTAGGYTTLARSFGHGPAFLVITLPAGTEPRDVDETLTGAEYIGPAPVSEEVEDEPEPTAETTEG